MWAATAATAGVAAGYFRIKASDDTCWVQGVVSPQGGGGLLQLDTINFPADTIVDLSEFRIEAGNG